MASCSGKKNDFIPLYDGEQPKKGFDFAEYLISKEGEKMENHLATNQRRGSMRNFRKKVFVVAACAAAMVSGYGSAHAADYTLTDFYKMSTDLFPTYAFDPNRGKPTNQAFSINDNGQVAGILKGQISSQSQTHVILWNNVGKSGTTASDLGFPLNPSTKNSVPYDINLSGQIVGYSYWSGSTPHGWIYNSSSSIVDLYASRPTGSMQTTATAINDSGVVVGYTGEGSTGLYAPTSAFIYDGSGTATRIPGATVGSTSGSSSATAINNNGLVTGYSTANGKAQAFIYDSSDSSSIATPLGTLGGLTSNGKAINDSGAVVGYSLLSDGVTSHAFLYENGQMNDLGALGGTANSSEANAINNKGVIVGNSNGHAFVYENGLMTDLNTLIDPSLGFTLINATGINNLGQIVGYGTVNVLYTDGKVYSQERAFALTPTPIPAALPLFASGLAGMFFMRRKKSLA
jgi:probable HAF family extracellular repeat protein